jgi:hypothetical protein
MKQTFDTITDWLTIPLFVAAMALLARADLTALRAPDQTRQHDYRWSRKAGATLGAIAFAITLIRFAVLSG